MSSIFDGVRKGLIKCASGDGECLVFVDVSGALKPSAANDVERAIRECECDERVERYAFNHVSSWPVSVFTTGLLAKGSEESGDERAFDDVSRTISSRRPAAAIVVVGGKSAPPSSLANDRNVVVVSSGHLRESVLPTVSIDDLCAMEEESLGSKFSEVAGCCDQLAEAVGAPALELVTMTESSALYAAPGGLLVRAAYSVDPDSVEFRDVRVFRQEPEGGSGARDMIAEALDALMSGDVDSAETKMGLVSEAVVKRIVGNRVVRHRLDRKLSRAMKMARRKHRGAWKAATMGTAVRKRLKTLAKHSRSGLIAKLQTSSHDASLDVDRGWHLLESSGFDPSIERPLFGYQVDPQSGIDPGAAAILLENAGVEASVSDGCVFVPGHGDEEWIAARLEEAGLGGSTVKTVGALNEARFRLRGGKIVRKVRVDRKRSAIAKKAARKNRVKYLKSLAKGRKSLKRLLGKESFKRLRRKVSSLNNEPVAAVATESWLVGAGEKMNRAVEFADQGDVSKSATIIAEVADEFDGLMMLTGKELVAFVEWSSGIQSGSGIASSIAKELRARLRASHPDLVVEALSIAKDKLDPDTELSDDADAALFEAVDMLYESIDEDVDCEADVYRCLSKRYAMVIAELESSAEEDGEDVAETVAMLRGDKDDLDRAVSDGELIDPERLYEMIVTLRVLASGEKSDEEIDPSKFLPVRQSSSEIEDAEDSDDDEDEDSDGDGDYEDDDSEDDDYEDDDDYEGVENESRRCRRESVEDATAEESVLLKSVEEKIESPAVMNLVRRTLKCVSDRIGFLKDLDGIAFVIAFDVTEAARKNGAKTVPGSRAAALCEGAIGDLVESIKAKIEAKYGEKSSEAKNTFAWVKWIIDKDFVKDTVAFLKKLSKLDEVGIEDVKHVAQQLI